MDIKEIVAKEAKDKCTRYRHNEVAGACSFEFRLFNLINFAEALIESYKAELLKEVGEPVAYINPNIGVAIESAKKWADRENSFSITAFTSDQVAAAILKATKPPEEEIERLKDEQFKRLEREAEKRMKLREQLATAEQRVAEACALACEDVIGNTANDQRMIAAIDCSAMIRSGEWRKFVKEG